MQGRAFRTAALALLTGSLAGTGWAATGSSCARWALEGLSPGMSAEGVLAQRPVEGMRSLIRDLDGVETSGVDYPGPPFDVYVEYDGRIDRRPPPRVMRVRLTMPPSPNAARELLERFGPPLVGAVDLENGLRQGIAVWIDEACDVVLTAHRPQADWWLPPAGLVLQLQPLGFVRSGITAGNAGLKATLEQAGAPEAPGQDPPTPPAESPAPLPESASEPPPPVAPPAIEEVLEAPPQPAPDPAPPEAPPAIEEVLEAPPQPAPDPAPPVAPPAIEEVLEAPPQPAPDPAPPVAPPVIEKVVEAPPQPAAPAKPATIATWHATPNVPAPPPPTKPATIATWNPPPAPPSLPRKDEQAGPRADRAAERIEFVPPVYPATAKWLGLKGEVTLKVIVRADGSVAQPPRVLAARPMGRGFEEAAVEAVRKWRYAPAIVGGRAVDSELTVRVEFE